MNGTLKKIAWASLAATIGAGAAVGAANAAMHGGMGPVGPAMGAGPHGAVALAHMGPVGHIGHIGNPGHIGAYDHHRFRRGFVFGVGDGYYGEYTGGCGYYRVRWNETGSRYWRARYLDCVDG